MRCGGDGSVGAIVSRVNYRLQRYVPLQGGSWLLLFEWRHAQARPWAGLIELQGCWWCNKEFKT